MRFSYVATSTSFPGHAVIPAYTANPLNCLPTWAPWKTMMQMRVA